MYCVFHSPLSGHSFWKKHQTHPNKKVKFSEDENLTEEECHSLLLEFMPKHVHVHNTKISQKLFVR